ncbi:MAG: phage replisome organizer N-terminal domain-containing protein [Clostridia bacterium]|nr:phage replisome organizer N-terminal domain-containing protein [Clostridia bacterium]
MGEVQWIKLYIDMFDKRKIKKLRRLPAGNDILLIWVMLLAMAGKCNAGGMIFITERVPYTEDDLAEELKFDVNTIKLALAAFEEMDMIATSKDGFISVLGWEEHQNVDRLAEIREYNRIAQQKSRAKKKLLNSVNDNVNDMSMTSQRCHDTDKDIDKDKDKEYKKKINKKESFVSPTLEEVQAYCESRGNKVDAKQFYDYFTASGWIDSKGNKVKSWKQKIITWESFRKDDKPQSKVGANGIAISNEKSDLEGVF